MKKIFILAALFASAFLTQSCESTGLDVDAAPQAFTPGVSATTTEREWKDGKPAEKRVENAPAFQ